MFIETDTEFDQLQLRIAEQPSIWLPVYSDQFRHYTRNAISFIYIYLLQDQTEHVISFRHKDCISLNTERIQELVSSHDIYVLAKKRFRHYYAKPCVDVDMVYWWQRHAMMPLNDTQTTAHEAWGRWWYNETNVNDWLPITRHIEQCQMQCQRIQDMLTGFAMTPEFRAYEDMVIDNFYAIEHVGLRVDPNIFAEHLKPDAIIGDQAFTEYNIYTTTGRPSNTFGGVNFAALNKEDGSRSAFTSRFSRGMLIEMDFDAFHVRLIADIIGYTLPSGSVHEYFGQQYFGKHDLTAEEYAQSKQITFRLLYGGIDKEFEEIAFFANTKRYIRALWKQYQQTGVVYTPIRKRPLHRQHLPEDMNANKLFNYMLQATETEHNMQVINDVHETLQGYNSKLVLYTYDSLLFDYDMSDGRELLVQLRRAMDHNGQFPVKIKAGVNYHVMQDMTQRVA